MSNRAGTVYSAPRDANREAVMLGVSSADADLPLPLEINPASGGVLMDPGGIGVGSYDYVALSNADGNGNYQTITFKAGGASGTIVNTLALTYDASSNVTSLTRT